MPIVAYVPIEYLSMQQEEVIPKYMKNTCLQPHARSVQIKSA